MKKLCQSLSILLICLLMFPIYSTKAEPKPRLIVSEEILNFNRFTKTDIPTLKFTVRNNEKGPIKGILKPSKKWIHLSQTSFEDYSTEISATVDPDWFSFQPGLYLEKIDIESDGGSFTLPIRLIVVEKKVKIEMYMYWGAIWVDGKKYEISCTPYWRHGKLFIPFGAVCDSLGAFVFPKLVEEKYLRGFTVEYKDILADITIRQPMMILNGKEVRITSPEYWFGDIGADWTIIYQIFGAKMSYEISERKITIEY
jgi:hypothetical protein